MLDSRLVFLRRKAGSLVNATGALKVQQPRPLNLIRIKRSTWTICSGWTSSSAFSSSARCPVSIRSTAALTLVTWRQSRLRNNKPISTNSRRLTTMPRAGKAHAAKLAYNNEDGAHLPSSTYEAVPDSSVRRSSRQKSAKPTTYEEKTSDVEDGEEKPEDVEMNTEDARQAIRDLVEMDNYLRENTKRQKLAVEQSNLPRQREDRQGMVSTDSSTVDARTKDTRFRQRKKPAPLPTPEKDSDPDFIKTEPDADYVPTTPHGTISESKEDPEAAEESVERAAARPPAVNSSYLPLPWKGRLGYACLNTYLRAAKPSVFSSRTCRMASIIDHRHPLQDPSMPEHPTKNKPDKTQQPEHALGMQFVEQLGLANARDIVKMLRWNDKYGIKFMRLSSEIFPFASHPVHGYSLAPFASEVLAEAGKVAAELGHRLTTHPGQYTQLGSPRKEVVDSAIRDLAYHDELLSLLKLPDQQNRDAIMIIHMGGVFGDKAATLDRFRTNYARLPASSKARLVLENDDVSWSVHELLPVCEELNIPLVLDFHHHNIVFDSSKVREGTLDISQPELMDRILATWRRKNIRPKMHYSEPTAGAVTPRDRRKHSARVMTLPPCPPDMDLMIEAKDKEQAVFELMRTFKLPGFEEINDMIPHEREDEPRPPVKIVKAKDGSGRKKKKKGGEAIGLEETAVHVDVEQVEKASEISPEDFGMGGPNNRVYWPLGREDWLKPKKRESTKKGVVDEPEVKEEE